MIIYSRKKNKKPVVVEKAIEEIKVEEPVVVKKPRRKTEKIIVSVEEPIVVEEKIEDEDLSKWLEEHTED